MSHSESNKLVLQLLQNLTETVETLLEIDDGDLGFPTETGCAMQGGIRRLLVHNAEHDRMHTGAVSTARFAAREMQEAELPRLVRELVRERAELVGQLLHMPDHLLEAHAPNDEWSIREHVEHTLYWEQRSLNEATTELAESA